MFTNGSGSHRRGTAAFTQESAIFVLIWLLLQLKSLKEPESSSMFVARVVDQRVLNVFLVIHFSVGLGPV